MNGIVQILPGVPIPAEIYGLKAAGIATLSNLRAASPVPYLVPESWAISTEAGGGRPEETDLRGAFENLTNGIKDNSVLMARSSATDESPGQNPTLFVHYDPSAIERSFSRFRDAVEQVRSVSPRMGVVVTRAVGRVSVLEGGARVFARGNISFVADTHNPTKPDEMHIALVHGLGTRAVEGNEAIVVTVDRETGDITYFGNQGIEGITLSRGRYNCVASTAEYRQKRQDFFDFGTGNVESEYLDDDIVARFRFSLIDHRLVEYASSNYLGATPFGNVGMFNMIVGALRYFAEAAGGPVQVEGAFPDWDTSEIHFYQHMPMPPSHGEVRPIEMEPPYILRSRGVVGKGRFEAPLIEISNDLAEYGYMYEDCRKFLRHLDELYGSRGYVLLAKKWARRFEIRPESPV